MTIPKNPFEPLHDCLLLELLKRRDALVLLPGETEIDSIFGFFCSKIGPGFTNEQGVLVPNPTKVEVGDEIILNGAAGYRFTHPRTGERKFVLIRARDILAIVKPEEPMDETTKLQLFGPHA